MLPSSYKFHHVPLHPCLCNLNPSMSPGVFIKAWVRWPKIHVFAAVFAQLRARLLHACTTAALQHHSTHTHSSTTVSLGHTTTYNLGKASTHLVGTTHKANFLRPWPCSCRAWKSRLGKGKAWHKPQRGLTTNGGLLALALLPQAGRKRGPRSNDNPSGKKCLAKHLESLEKAKAKCLDKPQHAWEEEALEKAEKHKRRP